MHIVNWEPNIYLQKFYNQICKHFNIQIFKYVNIHQIISMLHILISVPLMFLLFVSVSHCPHYSCYLVTQPCHFQSFRKVFHIVTITSCFLMVEKVGQGKFCVLQTSHHPVQHDNLGATRSIDLYTKLKFGSLVKRALPDPGALTTCLLVDSADLGCVLCHKCCL